MKTYCSQCGAEAEAGRFCEACGAPLELGAPQPPVQRQEREPFRRPEPSEPTKRRSAGKIPLLLGGAGLVILLIGGAWLLQNARHSPLVQDPFPEEPAAAAEAPQTAGAAENSSVGIEEFVGNWIPLQDSGGGTFWIQQVENRYVGADDLTIMAFSGVEDRTLSGVVTDGPHAGARVRVTLSEDGNGLSFALTQDQKPEIRYEAARNTSLGQGTVMTGDVEALETMVADAFREKEESHGAQLAEKEAALTAAIHELGDALSIYYVEEGRREPAEAQTHLREFLLSVTHNGFGMSLDFVEAMVQEALKP